MNKQIRILIGVALFALIIGISIYAYVNREVFFSNRVTIEYPDNCVEIYVNGEMISPECTVGREIANRKPKVDDSLYAFNMSRANI